MAKGVILGITLYSSLLFAEGSAIKLLQQKLQIKVESKSLEEKSMKIKDERKKNKSYPRGTIDMH